MDSIVLEDSNVSKYFDADSVPEYFVRELDKTTSAIYGSVNNTRSKDQVANATFRGLVAEIAFVKQYPQLVRKQGGFFDYDVSSLTDRVGTRIELKCPIHDKDWWVPVHYDYFYEVASRGKVDYIINTFLDDSTGMLYIKAMANAKSFENYLQQGPYNIYYNHFRASNDGECWLGQKAINKINSIIKENSWNDF